MPGWHAASRESWGCASDPGRSCCPAAPAALTEPDEVVCLATPGNSQLSATTTAASRRRATTEWCGCSTRLPSVKNVRLRRRKTLASMKTCRSKRMGCGSKDTSTFPCRLPEWWCSPTAAAAAATVRETDSSPRRSMGQGWAPCCLTCSAREELDRANVFNIELLALRLTSATDWLGSRPDTASCSVGFFGASTGAGAALWAADEQGARIGAVVSRGGRPDLAGERLALVRAPTLLIVGSANHRVLELNRRAKALLHCPQPAGACPGSLPPVRRTWDTGGGGDSGQGLVCAVPAAR
ncbi:putative phosphoribosyl transferase Rv0571c/MT0597 [Arthrobacter sp. Hiyo4]|nr:putative phosphoribosyl transferase Rv0571c/MT0597 [Arthrobacter sp. Hiyo4]